MKVAILSGSVYGTAEEVARHAQKLLSAAGLEASHLPRASLDELKAFAPEAFLVVTSTTGMGELPDNLQPLYYAIRDQLPAWHGLPGGVIGLGDSSYGDTFCGGGEQVRELFGELGVREVLPMLRLGLPLLGADALFAQRFAEYRRRYPNIAVHLVEGGSKTMEQAVLAGELELAGSLTPADDGFDYQPFCNEPLDVLLPAGHPKAAAASVALGELADSPFLLYQQSFTLNDRLLRACLEAGFSPREGGRSGQADFLGALVAANQGVVLLPRVIAREIERPGVVRVLLREPDLRWDIAFIWRRGGYLSRAAQAWLELLREQPLEESPA